MKKNTKQNVWSIVKQLCNRNFWVNILAMVLVLVIAYIVIIISLRSYTRHGEQIVVPNIEKISFANAKTMIEDSGLKIAVSDTGYNRQLPADCILMQIPAANATVKEGRVIYVTVNTDSSPTLAMPNLTDNCSRREAEARLRAMGFTLLKPKLVHGERDWVIGVEAQGRMLQAGDRVSVETPLRIHVGTGKRETEVIQETLSDDTDAFSDETDAAEEEIIMIR